MRDSYKLLPQKILNLLYGDLGFDRRPKIGANYAFGNELVFETGIDMSSKDFNKSLESSPPKGVTKKKPVPPEWQSMVGANFSRLDENT